MFERTTDRASKVCEVAQVEARRLGHNYVGTEHLLLALIAEGQGPAAAVLRAQGATLEAARSAVARLVDQGVLPGPRPNDAELLEDLGIDLDEVRRRTEESFGQDAVDRAAGRVTRRQWRRGAAWTPLCGLPVAPRLKRAWGSPAMKPTP